MAHARVRARMRARTHTHAHRSTWYNLTIEGMEGMDGMDGRTDGCGAVGPIHGPYCAGRSICIEKYLHRTGRARAFSVVSV